MLQFSPFCIFTIVSSVWRCCFTWCWFCLRPFLFCVWQCIHQRHHVSSDDGLAALLRGNLPQLPGLDSFQLWAEGRQLEAEWLLREAWLNERTLRHPLIHELCKKLLHFQNHNPVVWGMSPCPIHCLWVPNHRYCQTNIQIHIMYTKSATYRQIHTCQPHM